MDAGETTRQTTDTNRANWPPKKIAVGMVLFHPPEATQTLIATANEQFDAVFVVDNTPDPRGAFTLPQPTAHLISNQANSGLAVAINQLCAAAREAGFDWLLLLDQDSQLPADFSADFRAAMDGLDAAPGIFAANYCTRLAGTTLPGYVIPYRQKTGRVLNAINSGSLINLSTHQALGGHDESFFVDHVDHEYCLRLKKHGFAVHATQAPLFEHQIGQVISKQRFGRVWQSSGHSPQRRAEWARGLVWLGKRYWRTAPGWCGERLFIEWPRHFLAMLILEDQRWRKGLALVNGLMQGILSSPSPPQTYNLRQALAEKHPPR